jgi:hypothetical protein
MLRVAIALMTLAWMAVVLAAIAPGHALIRYWLFVVAHLLNAGGFLLAAVSDALVRRPFSTVRLAYAIIVGLLFLIIGPVFMSAAAASWGSPG